MHALFCRVQLTGAMVNTLPPGTVTIDFADKALRDGLEKKLIHGSAPPASRFSTVTATPAGQIRAGDAHTVLPESRGRRVTSRRGYWLPSTTVAVFQRVAVLPLGVMLVRRMSLHCVTAFPAAACYPVPVMARSRAL